MVANPEYPSVLAAVLSHAEATPDKTAVVDRDGRTSYAGLAAMIRTAAANLRAAGVRKGDRVMLAAVPCARFVAAYFACHYIGAAAVPVDKNAVKDSLLWMRDFLETDFVFYEGELTGEIGATNLADLLKPCGSKPEAPVTLGGEDLASIIFTSATTGKPKGVMLTHRNLCAIAEHKIKYLTISPDTIWLNPMPLHHSGALNYLYSLLYNNGTLVLEDGLGSISNFYKALKQNNCTGTNLAPSGMNILYDQTKNNIFKLLGSLKIIFLGSMATPLNMKEKIIADLPQTNIYNSYGATECIGITSINLRSERDKSHTAGKAASGVSIKIVDNKYNEIKSNERQWGIISVSSDAVMKGYWRDEHRTNAAIIKNWLMMNDMGYIDQDGYLVLAGRTDDVINTGGEKVSPFEIENMVNMFDNIKESCCVSVPDSILGNVPVVFVTVRNRETFQEDALLNYLKSHLDKYKTPREIIVVDVMPKNSIGKLLRKDLFQIWLDAKKHITRRTV